MNHALEANRIIMSMSTVCIYMSAYFWSVSIWNMNKGFWYCTIEYQHLILCSAVQRRKTLAPNSEMKCAKQNVVLIAPYRPAVIYSMVRLK